MVVGLHGKCICVIVTIRDLSANLVIKSIITIVIRPLTVIILMKMRWAEYVARMGKVKYRFATPLKRIGEWK
jgi:hypothetical protein